MLPGLMAMLLAVSAASAPAADSGELAPPVKVTAGGRPIDVECSGHSAPSMGDVDGDGLKDLIVGELYQGRMRVYRNVGAARQPRFEKSTWFVAGGKPATVPDS